MKFHGYKNRLGNAGSTMLMGLMVMAFGTAGIAAWVSLLSARSEQVNNYESVSYTHLTLPTIYSV